MPHPFSIPGPTGIDGNGETTDELLRQLIQMQLDRDPMDSLGTRRTATRGQQNYGIAELDVTLAQDRTRLVVAPTYHLEFVQWPEVLDVLTVRIGDPGRQPIDILRSGHIIESDIPIKDIFITTSPPIPDGGTVRVLGGNLKIHGLRTTNFGCLPVCPPIFEQFDGEETSIDFAQAFNALTKPSRFSVQESAVNAGPVTLYSNIPAGTPYRVYGTISYLLASAAGSQTLGRFLIALGADHPWQANFDGTDGNNIFHFDTGWGEFGTDDHRFNFVLGALGPVGQLIGWSTHLEIIPQL